MAFDDELLAWFETSTDINNGPTNASLGKPGDAFAQWSMNHHLRAAVRSSKRCDFSGQGRCQ